MEYRSTNPTGYTHWQGDMVSNVASSHGVQLSGGSTGAVVEAVGDDGTIELTVRGKSTGAVNIGAAGAVTNLLSYDIFTSSGANLKLGSTAPFKGFIRQQTINQPTPNFASTDAGKVAETTVTFTGVNSSHFIVANALTFPAGLQLVHAYAVATTAASVHLGWVNGSSVTVGASTANVRLLAIRF